MKSTHNLISSTLKTIACDNVVSEYELTQASDKNLQDILNEQEQDQKVPKDTTQQSA